MWLWLALPSMLIAKLRNYLVIQLMSASAAECVIQMGRAYDHASDYAKLRSSWSGVLRHHEESRQDR